MRRVALAAILFAAIVPEVEGDILRFREGGETTVPATVEGEVVRLDTPMGLLRFPLEDFREIVACDDIESEWASRCAEARATGGDAVTVAAFWGFDHGLTTEADVFLRNEHDNSPSDRTTKLVRCLDRLRGDWPDPDVLPLLRNLPRGMKVARGPHVFLLHEHGDADAAERVQLIERVITGFYVYFHDLGFDLPIPDRKIASAWFARKGAYRAYLRAEGAGGFASTRGYHHAVRNLVVAYDCRDDPERRKVREEIAGRRAELATLDHRIEAMPPSARLRIGLDGTPSRLLDREGVRSSRASLGREVDRREMVAELGRREVDWAIAAHETAHQLVAQSGLAPSHDRFPEWLHEGLAMQFEAIRGGRWAGLATPSRLRTKDFLALGESASLEATLDESAQGRGYNRDRYARAWGLVFYLRKYRADGFVALLDSLRAPGAATARETIGTRSLRDAVGGDLLVEERRWHEAMKALPPP